MIPHISVVIPSEPSLAKARAATDGTQLAGASTVPKLVSIRRGPSLRWEWLRWNDVGV